MKAVDTSLPPSRELVRMYLATLAFRFRHMTAGAPEGFGDFEAGAGVRTPAQIVRHMTWLLDWVRSEFAGQPRTGLEDLPYQEECARFLASARMLDRLVRDDGRPEGDLAFDQLWRGPLADAMTHVGQLATLRRLAGAPIDMVRYPYVNMPYLDG